jgi:hypothetical protein
MGTQRDPAKYIAVTRVRRGREEGFESLIPALAAAVAQARPHLSGQWQLLRPDRDQDSPDGAVYLFLFYGPATLDEWDVEGICIESLGEGEGRRLAEQILGCLDGEQEVHTFSGEVSA